MKSQASFINKGILKSDLKRFGWIGFFYFVALFFMFPFNIMMNYKEYIKDFNEYTLTHIFGMMPSILMGTMLAVGLAVVLLNFMHSKRESDVIHSLPVKRSSILNTKILFGLSLIILPIVLNGIILVVINGVLGLESVYSIQNVFNWCMTNITYCSCIYMTSIVVGICTGNFPSHAVLTFITMFFPCGFTSLITSTLSMFVYGYSGNGVRDVIIKHFSPYTYIGYVQPHLPVFMYVEYIVIGITCYILSMHLYKIRKVESYHETIAFKSLKPVFKYGFTFCFMLLGGIYFNQYGIMWALIGYVIVSCVAFFVSKIILQKSIYVFNNFKEYAVYLLVMVVMLGCVKLDVVGYESKIPNIDDVKTVYYGDTFMKYDNHVNDFYKDYNNIQSIQNVHKTIIENKDKNKKIERNYKNRFEIEIIYKMKNNKKIYRTYNLPNGFDKKYEKDLLSVYNSNEWKKNQVSVLNNKQLEYIEMYGMHHDKITIYGNDFVNSLKQDIQNIHFSSLEDMDKIYTDIRPTKKYMTYNSSKDYRFEDLPTLTFYKQYTNFEDWLKQNGYWDKLVINPNQVSKIIIQRRDENQRDNDEIDTSIKHMTITDENKMGEILNNVKWDYYDNEYIIKVYDKGSVLMGEYAFDNIPTNVAKYFK